MLCVVVGPKMAAKSASNSFLFTNEDGSPMVFVITPGDTKTRLRPIVENGGGVLTSQETPGAIRLVERDYKSGKRLVSSDFVFDSYKIGTLCNIEEYRLETKPDVYVSGSKNHITVATEKVAQNGRIKYSFEEDQAILDYIKKFEGQDIKLSGNKIWQEMETKKVTCHRWQSMRSHYLSFLRQNSCASSQKGKLEFVENKSISRSQNSNNAKTFENISTCKKNIPTSSHSFQKDVKVKEERKDKENVCASLPNKQQHTATSFENNYRTCNKIVQETYETSSYKKNNFNMLDKSESHDVEGKDMHVTESQDIEAEVLHDTSSSSSFVDMSSTTCCNKRSQPDDAEFCATCRKQNVPESSCIEGSKKSCNSGIRKYFKVQSKDNTSDKVESGNVVPKYMLCIHENQDITDECVPVLNCKLLFENFKQIQMISQKSLCGTQTPAAILHALFVSCGCLKCAFHYLQTGLLLNGQEIWKNKEDIVISSGDAVAINEIVNKRGHKAVDYRRQFIGSIY